VSTPINPCGAYSTVIPVLLAFVLLGVWRHQTFVAVAPAATRCKGTI
jgi:hypothetical protein